MKPVLDSTNRSRKRPPAMGESDPQFRKTFEHATENHRADRKRTFGRHPDKPRQPVLRHSFLAHHVPGVNENRGVQILSCFPNDIERGMIEISAVRTVAMIVWVDVGADLYPAQSQFSNTPG